AIVGFFALISTRIPPGRATLYVALFFLGSLTQAIGELASLVSPGVYFIFLIFPLTEAGVRGILNDPGVTAGVFRLGGLSIACVGVFSWMLARHGIAQIFRSKHF